LNVKATASGSRAGTLNRFTGFLLDRSRKYFTITFRYTL